MKGAVILAGGTSERLANLGKPKQFFEVNGIPIIEYVLNAFEMCMDIDQIVIVANENWHHIIPKTSKFAGFATPGKSRQHSVYNGLIALQDILADDDIVVVHDAARPLISELDVCKCIHAVEGYDGAMPVLQLKDTVYKSIDGKIISALLNRDELFAGQAPEAYRFGKYFRAHKGASFDAIRGSSEIAFNAGMKIHLFQGNPLNMKVTTTADLEYLKFLLEC